MEDDGINPLVISTFQKAFDSLVMGKTGMVPESTISPVSDLPTIESFRGLQADSSLLSSTVVLKLNGGLGTSMGLEGAKSLLIAKGDETFLDLTAKQILALRKAFPNNKVKFMLMNSFSTSADTLAFLRHAYPELTEDEDLEILQNKIPKIDAATYEVRQDISCFVFFQPFLFIEYTLNSWSPHFGFYSLPHMNQILPSSGAVSRSKNARLREVCCRFLTL